MDHSSNLFDTLRRYLITLINIMSWKVALALGLMICLSLMEGISLLMLVPLLQLVGLNVQAGLYRSSCRIYILHLLDHWDSTHTD